MKSVLSLASAAFVFALFSSLFFLAIGRSPGTLYRAMWEGSFGSAFALSETLVKASPILLCGLATALPAALGLISVGAEGQLFMGSIAGTAFVLGYGDRLGILSVPALLFAAALGGGSYGALAAVLRSALRVNETISTLLLNYLPPLLVEYLVYGPWKDPQSLGWPATVSFPEGARLDSYFDSRLHLGIAVGVGCIIASHWVLTRTRWGLAVSLLKESPLLAARAGFSFKLYCPVLLALGGAMAGIAGMIEVSVIEGRLQSGVGVGAGYSGFLVAFLARGRLLRLLPLTLGLAALIASGDNLQLTADLPSSVVYVLQGLLFAAALIAERPRPSARSVEAR